MKNYVKSLLLTTATILTFSGCFGKTAEPMSKEELYNITDGKVFDIKTFNYSTRPCQRATEDIKNLFKIIQEEGTYKSYYLEKVEKKVYSKEDINMMLNNEFYPSDFKSKLRENSKDGVMKLSIHIRDINYRWSSPFANLVGYRSFEECEKENIWWGSSSSDVNVNVNIR